VLADGRTTASGLPATTPTDRLVEFMVGRKVEQLYPDRPVGTDRVLLEVRDVRRLPAVRGVSLQVHAGEVVGLGGLVGSGRTELLGLIYGLDQPEDGEVLVEGKPLRPGPRHAIRRGLGLAPEDRKSQALVLDWSQTKNVTVADLGRFSRVLLDVRKERERAREQLRALNTVPDDPDRVVRLLSGGNQQKVVLARWLLHECRVLLLDEPTRGVDIATKAEIYRIISDLAKSGLGVLVVSSELEELVHICTRILVMREGEIVAEVDGKDATERELLRHAVAPTDAPVLAEEVV
jgi:ribose transport system ATP-binding protein